MQKLIQVFEKLTQGELSQVSIGGNQQGEITEANYRTLANHVSMGLTSLYKRFNLKQGQVDVRLIPGKMSYLIHSRFADHGKYTNEPVRWVQDSMTNRFNDDILKIIKVSNQQNYEFPLNTHSDPFAVITPTLESIRFPLVIVSPTSNIDNLLKTTVATVHYQANHPNIIPRVGYLDPNSINIELPDSHIMALLYFVASRVHNPIGMGQEFNAGNNWFAKYEQECQRLEFDGQEIESYQGVDRIRRGGWI